ncbi:MAG TPA: WecB/TagA/CpsF family glycosyltransferase [Chthoniobacterales bacterium]|nr:WecB/TagA/CpsF family glycosyltransferase [Chthoniobacterales bacterium]
MELIERVLGVRFFTGTVAEAVERHTRDGGSLVIPAAPALIKLNYDQGYRNAMQNADLALADSGLLVLLSRLALHRPLTRISGMTYFKSLLAQANLSGNAFWIFASESAREHAAAWLRPSGTNTNASNSFVAAAPASSEKDYEILTRIEEEKPKHVIIAMPGGHQEELALYLRDYLLYRPAIHCVGAALNLLSGEEKAIPAWAERGHLGWLFRFFAQPRMVLPRIGIAFALARMIFKYGSELPPLKKRWADV